MAGIAQSLRHIAAFKADPHRGFGAARYPIGGRARSGEQIKPHRIAGPISAEAAQILHNIAHTFCAIFGAINGHTQVLYGFVEPEFIAQRPKLGPGCPGFHGIKIRLKPAGVFFQSMGVGIDKADRVVQLMRDPGDQTAK